MNDIDPSSAHEKALVAMRFAQEGRKFIKIEYQMPNPTLYHSVRVPYVWHESWLAIYTEEDHKKCNIYKLHPGDLCITFACNFQSLERVVNANGTVQNRSLDAYVAAMSAWRFPIETETPLQNE